MLQGRPIPVFGDGTSGRDYTFVADIVGGVLAAIDYRFRSDQLRFDVFNLGNSHPVSLNELIQSLELVAGCKAIRDPKPPQAGDVPMTWANTEKAARVLGYKAKTSLVEGLKTFVQWQLREGQKVR